MQETLDCSCGLKTTTARPSLTRSLKARFRKNEIAALKEHTSVLAAILRDISYHSDTNFIYILSVGEQMSK